MSSIKDMQDAIQAVRYNPAAVQRLTLNALDEMKEGSIDIVDATNPFMFLLTTSAVHASAAMTEAANLTRKQYPSMALTEDEIYLHMSDKDYIGRFATPSRTHFSLLFHKGELVNRAVPVPDSNVRKMVIPRHTEFKVSDYTFTLQYPIELRVMGHGGIQVVYDATEPSPIQTIESNILDWHLVTINREEYLRIEIPVEQITLISHLAQLNSATAYSKTFPITDNFYYCRVWRTHSDGRWVEIKTTHTDQVFDPHAPTLLLKVYENSLRVTLPHVYLSSGLLDGELRIDIYTTKGPLDLILESYPANAFSARWRDVAKPSLDKYSHQLVSFSGMTLFSDAVVSGGTNPLTFETLRERVIHNAIGEASLPITNQQMISQLTNKGYTPVLDVDNVTNRIYLASRHLPSPTYDPIEAPIGARITSLQDTFNRLIHFRGVVDNGDRITLTPNTLFQEINGAVSVVNNQSRDDLESTTGEVFLQRVNTENYYYTPFYYVLDPTGRYFDARAYHLCQPKVTRRQYIQENDSLDMTLSTKSIEVIKRPDGYTLRVLTQSSESALALRDADIRVQIAITPQGQRKAAYLLGVLQGLDPSGERIYHFDLNTRFDVTKEHGLQITNLRMSDNEARNYPVDIETDVEVIYYVNPSLTTSTPEYLLSYTEGRFQVDTSFYGITHERIGLRFGRYLEGFWNNSRSVMDSVEYDVYQEDVYAFYESNVYRRDSVTGHIDISLDVNGDIVYELLHAKGDPVLDAQGDPVIQHYKGDVKVDHDGEPIILSSRDVLRETDIFLLDGRYFYSDHDLIREYLSNVSRKLEAWLLDDIHLFRSWALEQTEIYLYPRRTLGVVKARVRENEEYLLDLEQSFSVTYYLSRERYHDNYLRGILARKTHQVLAKHLEGKRVTISGIVSELNSVVGEEVLALKVEGLGGSENLAALTLESDTDRCSIRKRLKNTLDGHYTVESDISIQYLRHEDQ